MRSTRGRGRARGIIRQGFIGVPDAGWDYPLTPSNRYLSEDPPHGDRGGTPRGMRYTPPSNHIPPSFVEPAGRGHGQTVNSEYARDFFERRYHADGGSRFGDTGSDEDYDNPCIHAYASRHLLIGSSSQSEESSQASVSSDESEDEKGLTGKQAESSKQNETKKANLDSEIASASKAADEEKEVIPPTYRLVHIDIV